MGTTIRLNDELLRKAKIRATETDRTLAEVIEDALRKEIEETDAGIEPGWRRLSPEKQRLVFRN